ncbi:unnamed protein product, partial [Rotaria socialis]
PVATANGK